MCIMRYFYAFLSLMHHQIQLILHLIQLILHLIQLILQLIQLMPLSDPGIAENNEQVSIQDCKLYVFNSFVFISI